MTRRELETIAKGVGAVVRPLAQRIAELEATALRDGGIWEPGKTYPKGSAVTHRGSLWVALQDTNSRPGDPDPSSRAWRLRVKQGALS